MLKGMTNKMNFIQKLSLILFASISSISIMVNSLARNNLIEKDFSLPL